uniref:7TM_GPCR_Srx domain-containing protein n=1 Tax=Steinernema glaseri TaxID=37863 RepID=A0A1I8AL87_9BILA
MNITKIIESDQYLAAVLIIFLALAGVFINCYVLYAILKCKVFGRSFGAICVSQISANCGNSVIFAFLVGPITLIDKDFHSTYWGARCGQALIVFWNASQFSHLLTAINRFVNLYCSLKYETIFNPAVTKYSIIVVWTVALIQGVPYFWPQCTLEFNVESYTFGFLPTSCATWVGYYFDFDLSVAVIIFIFIIDFSSFLKIRMLKKLKSKDIKFFFQAWVQALAAITELVVYFWVAPLVAHDKWTHFCLTTIAWITVELTDGVVVIIFNKDIRDRRRNNSVAPAQCLPTHTSVQRESFPNFRC